MVLRRTVCRLTGHYWEDSEVGLECLDRTVPVVSKCRRCGTTRTDFRPKK